MTITCTGNDKDGHSYHFGMPPTDWKLPKGYMIKMDSYPSRFAEVVSNLKIEPWDGEGLPPVGTVCEHLPYNGGSEWHKVEIIAHKNHLMPVAVFWDLRELKASCSSAHAFRPIRTPEQIAAEVRQEALSEMFQLWNDAACNAADGFAAIYDAGYRKFEIVDN